MSAGEKAPRGIGALTAVRNPRRNASGSRGPCSHSSFGARGERVGRSIAPGHGERGRLDDGERAQELRPPRRGEERDHAAVRVPDEVRARLEELVEPGRLVLEVDRLDVRAGREAAPVRDDELEALASGRCAAQVASPLTTLPCTSRTRGARHEAIVESGTKSTVFAERRRSAVLQAFARLWYSRPADAGRLPVVVRARRRRWPALAVLVLCIGAGVLIGWLAGSAGIGVLIGAVAGILGGIFAVYRRYRGVI